MRLTNRGMLAVATMIDMASHSSGGPMRMADVAGRQGISRTYMEMMLSKLRRHKLVKAWHGPGGGYALARNAQDISVGDIIFAIDGPGFEPAPPAEPRADRLSTDALWSALSERMVEYLDSVSLASLARAHLARGAPSAANSRFRPSKAGPGFEAGSRAPNSVFAPGALTPHDEA